MTTADFTADELATLARFDATPAAPESWGRVDSELRDELARKLAAYDGRTLLYATDFARANIALAVFAAHLGQQQAAIEQVKALAVGSSVDAGGLYVDGWNAAMTEIRTALGADL